MKRNNITLDSETKRFIQIKPPEKLPPVELTLEDKARVLEEFRQIFKREPDPEEIEELFIEELKLKNNIGSN